MKNTMNTVKATIKNVLAENGWTLKEKDDMEYLLKTVKENPYDADEIYSAFYSCIKEDVDYTEVEYQVQEAFFTMDESLKASYPTAYFVQLMPALSV